jgi:hypothetical protein
MKKQTLEQEGQAYQEAYRRIFEKLIKGDSRKELKYHQVATGIAARIATLNNRELHAVYMGLKAIKNGRTYGKTTRI